FRSGREGRGKDLSLSYLNGLECLRPSQATPVNHRVGGSSPSAGARFIQTRNWVNAARYLPGGRVFAFSGAIPRASSRNASRAGGAPASSGERLVRSGVAPGVGIGTQT